MIDNYFQQRGGHFNSGKKYHKAYAIFFMTKTLGKKENERKRQRHGRLEMIAGLAIDNGSGYFLQDIHVDPVLNSNLQ